MKSLCFWIFRELLLFSAIALSDVALPMSSLEKCIEQLAEKESSVVIKNIGIKMCQARCIETGGCLRFEFHIDSLTCRLKLGNSKRMEKKKESNAHLKTHPDVAPGQCHSTSCSLGARCLESRYGKPVCVKGGRTFYTSTSQQQRRGKKSRSGNTLLHLACKKGDLTRVRTIMSRGHVDIDSRHGEYGRTPVMLAARWGHNVVFEYLVGKGCNMSLPDDNHNNILHMACYGGQIAIVKLVLSRDIVDINSRGHYGRTCVMIAALQGNLDLLKYLVNKGCGVSLLDDSGDSILHIACKGRHVEMVKYIISKDIVDVNGKGRDARTVALVAAHLGYRNIFDLCACAGCNLSAVDADGNNVLHVAILGGHTRMVKHVLEQRTVNINSRGRNGITPLMLAASEGHREVFDSILDEGGDTSLVDTNGDNVLHWVCRGGHVEMVMYIISQNFADINSRGQWERTPMMVAAYYGHRKVFDLLVSKGGDASLVDTNGDNILHRACHRGHTEIVQYVISKILTDINSRGYCKMTPLMMAAYRGHREVFDLVMNNGGDALLVDKNGDNILHWVCRGGHVEMVKYIILQNFIDINSRGQYGRTPMMVAAYSGNRKVLDLVMSRGGDASNVDMNGDNILHLASWQGNVMMVKHILSKTIIDVNAKDKRGKTAAMMVNKTKHKEIYDLLTSLG